MKSSPKRKPHLVTPRSSSSRHYVQLIVRLVQSRRRRRFPLLAVCRGQVGFVGGFVARAGGARAGAGGWGKKPGRGGRAEAIFWALASPPAAGATGRIQAPSHAFSDEPAD